VAPGQEFYTLERNVFLVNNLHAMVMPIEYFSQQASAFQKEIRLLKEYFDVQLSVA